MSKDIQGYKSALFSMDKANVKQTIITDFSLTPEDIKNAQNTQTRTSSLKIEVDDLIPSIKKSKIAYIFGYKSRELIQVNISWQEELNILTSEQILGIASSLQTHFKKQGFIPENTVTGVNNISGSLILFRATDHEGDILLLVLEGLTKQYEASLDNTQGQPLTLKLSYQDGKGSQDIYQETP